MEAVDEIEGVTNDIFARLRPYESADNLDEDSIAVIGFWKLNER